MGNSASTAPVVHSPAPTRHLFQDPRSPTPAVARTPDAEATKFFDPRSPSTKVMRTPVEEAKVPFDPRSPGLYRTPVAQDENQSNASPYHTPMGKDHGRRGQLVKKKNRAAKALDFTAC
mmetsp:Transcript_13178/g.52590  ORF Transcript_13178/g.52590 Transcript_13178/m.52590 type:complete len:119 (-) Transcript_13178:1850-2206(-)